MGLNVFWRLFFRPSEIIDSWDWRVDSISNQLSGPRARQIYSSLPAAG